MTTTPATVLPDAIAAYLDASDRRDAPVALAQFATDAVVIDDGHTFSGTEEIDAFIRTAGSEYTFTRTLLDTVENSPGEWTVTNRVEGNFPGGIVDLHYRFSLDGGLITHLDIAP